LHVVRARNADGVYAFPRPELARLERRGSLHRLARGYYAIVPAEHQDGSWLPTLEAAAAGIAAADVGADQGILMGISAARVHGAIPRALTTAVVALPRQRRPIRLLDRAATVIFVKRDPDRLDAGRLPTDLGPALVTGVEQTALDLAHRPELGDNPNEAQAAIRALVPRCDRGLLDHLATTQRLGAARDRALAAAG
jgi:predicted transcriptional regulator of viral defense system